MTDLILKVVEEYMKDNHPDMLGVHSVVKARITKVRAGGDAVDIQLLKSDGSVDLGVPEIPSVKFPRSLRFDTVRVLNAHDITVSSGSITVPDLVIEVIRTPSVNDIVRVGFYYNDLSQPYIEGWA